MSASAKLPELDAATLRSYAETTLAQLREDMSKSTLCDPWPKTSGEHKRYTLVDDLQGRRTGIAVRLRYVVVEPEAAFGPRKRTRLRFHYSVEGCSFTSLRKVLNRIYGSE